MAEEEKKYFDAVTKQKTVDELNKKWTKLQNCECCGARSWSIADDLVAPPIFNGGYTIGGIAYPQIMVVCGNCGNTKYFNINILGTLNAIKKDGGSDV